MEVSRPSTDGSGLTKDWFWDEGRVLKREGITPEKKTQSFSSQCIQYAEPGGGGKFDLFWHSNDYFL